MEQGVFITHLTISHRASTIEDAQGDAEGVISSLENAPGITFVGGNTGRASERQMVEEVSYGSSKPFKNLRALSPEEFDSEEDSTTSGSRERVRS